MNGGGGSNYTVFQSNGSEDSDLGFVQGGSGDDTIDAFGEDGVINGAQEMTSSAYKGRYSVRLVVLATIRSVATQLTLEAEHHYMAMLVTTFSFWKTRQAIK